jgi:Zn-dependent M28 family amino/carboxypeptidase
LTLAHVLKEYSGLHDLRLILFGGEEQGLLGSSQYVEDLSNRERSRISAIINMDMIASLNTPFPTVMLEGAPVSQSIIAELEDAATDFSLLTVQTSLRPFGSDHVPFIRAGLPAVLTIEGTDSANQTIHTAEDTLSRVSLDLVMEILRMNLGFIANKLGHL